MKENKENTTAQKPPLTVVGWTEYDGDEFPDCEDLDDEIYEAVAKDVRENGYLFGGDSHQDRYGCCPVLSNGKKACFSWRGWGLVIAIAYDKRCNDGSYDYMVGYMDMMINPKKLKYPESEVDYSKIVKD